jgi:hypothetical protein
MGRHIGLSYRHAGLHSWRAGHPYAGVDFIPGSEIYEFSYFGQNVHKEFDFVFNIK